MDRKAFGLIMAAMTVVICGTASNSLAGLAPTTGVVTNVDIGFFYDRLAPYGDWQQHARWGWVWCPRDVAVGWRPYTLGHWVYTDDYGWLWESDEDWGWACYHYGRWDWDDDLGWFWVPGSYWGPAWVAWRTGPGLGSGPHVHSSARGSPSPTQNTALGGPFIGWCPLPPAVQWQPNVGLAFNGVDLDDIPSRRWVFVEASFFDVPRLQDRILLVSRNVTLLRETRPLTRFESVDGRIINRAFSDREVQEFTHRPVTHFRVRQVDNPAALRVFRERDGEIPLFTPRIQRGAAGLVPPGPGEFERRQEAERAQLQEHQRAEQLRQQERHEAERARTRSGPSDRGGVRGEQLQQRQEAERQALQSEHARQQRQLESRQSRQREELGGRQARSNVFGSPGGPAAERPVGPGAETPGPQGRGSRR